MSIPNDTDRRTIGLHMTPLEALMTLESLSIGAATMIASERRRSREANVIRGMEERLVAETGLSPRTARMLADGMSGIFTVVAAISQGGVSDVTIRLKRGSLASVTERILAIVDGKEMFLADIELTTDERRKDPDLDFWENEERTRAITRDTFDGIVGEVVGFLKAEAPMEVEFRTEASLSVTIPRTMIPYRNTESVTDTLVALMDEAFGTEVGETAILQIDSDIWNDRKLVEVTGRVIVPYVHLGDHDATLQQTIDVATVRPAPAPRPA